MHLLLANSSSLSIVNGATVHSLSVVDDVDDALSYLRIGKASYDGVVDMYRIEMKRHGGYQDEPLDVETPGLTVSIQVHPLNL